MLKDKDYMENSVADRIQQRLDALGKTASGVAIEAGMGRSSVRDILNGKAANPRLDTLRKLTGPLECSLAYLTGQTDAPSRRPVKAKNWQDIQVEVEPVEDVIEQGAFRVRPNSWDLTVQGKIEEDVTHYVSYPDLRLPMWGTFNYELADNSMAELGIYKGDIVTGAHHVFEHEIELHVGRLVIVRHRLMVPGIEEVSLREVYELDGRLMLTSRPASGEIRAIVIRKPNESDVVSSKSPNLYLSEDGGEVRIEALAVRVTRELEI
jgi:transcriptional regulator with XRE-family HTH domain